jgi:hypothetical protein
VIDLGSGFDIAASYGELPREDAMVPRSMMLRAAFASSLAVVRVAIVDFLRKSDKLLLRACVGGAAGGPGSSSTKGATIFSTAVLEAESAPGSAVMT